MDKEILIENIIKYGAKIVTAILILLIGLFVIKMIVNVTREVLKGNKMDATLAPFIVSIVNISLKVLLFITVISMLGVQMTSFVAILGAAGLAIGLAFQGSLSNFASGVLILIFRPFNVGDFIESQGNKGFVDEIQIFYTILLTEDRKKIIMANSGVYSNVIGVDTSKKKA